MFSLEITRLYWIREEVDDPEDLCLHGIVRVALGDRVMEEECSVSAGALQLMRSISEEHVADASGRGIALQMLPCCGHGMFPTEAPDRVLIIGCANGLDWTVRHEDGRVMLSVDGEDCASLPADAYREAVFAFADAVEAYYGQCAPKRLPEDRTSREGYLAFWREWRRLRRA